MGGHEYYQNDIADLPPDAFVNGGGPSDPDDSWLKTAEEKHQIAAMRAWFTARYCDPAYETPYNGREGGYLYINGGPYDPADELDERFGGVVPDEVIQRLVDDLYWQVGHDWAPLRYGRDDPYDDDYGVEVPDPESPMRSLRGRMHELRQLVENAPNDVLTAPLVCRLAYAAAITSLESFLWETVVYWLDHDDGTAPRIIQNVPHFKEQKVSLGKIYERIAGIKDEIKGYLQTLVWHRWNDVAPLFKYGLEVTPPSFKEFDEPMRMRHDIVHRSGLTKEGEAVVVLPGDVLALQDRITAFAEKLHDAIRSRRADNPDNQPAPESLAIGADSASEF